MINKEKERALAVSHNIKKYRKTLDLKQRELAEMLNVASATVSSWEQGISTPDLDTIFDLCNIFNLSVEELATVPQPEEGNENYPEAKDGTEGEMDPAFHEETARMAYMLDLSIIEKKLVIAYRTADKLDKRLFERIGKISKDVY